MAYRRRIRKPNQIETKTTNILIFIRQVCVASPHSPTFLPTTHKVVDGRTLNVWNLKFCCQWKWFDEYLMNFYDVSNSDDHCCGPVFGSC